MRQKILFTLLLYILGAAVYLSVSGAPLRVHAVELPFHLIFLLLVALIVSTASLSHQRRWVAFGLLVLLGSLLLTVLRGRVIHALYPLHPAYFIGGFVALTVELLVVLGLLWSVDRALLFLARRRQPTGSEPPPP